MRKILLVLLAFLPTAPLIAAATATPSQVQTHTKTRTATASPTKTPTRSITATFSASPTPSATRTVTLSATRTATPSASPTWTASPALTATPTPSVTQTRTATRTSTRTGSPTATPTGTPSATPTSTPVPAGQVGRQVHEYIPFTGSWDSNLYNLELTYAPGAQAPFLSAYIVRQDFSEITAIQNQIAFTTVPVTENPGLLRNSMAIWWTGGRGITLFDKGFLLSGNVPYLLSVSYITGGTPTATPTFSVSPSPTATPSASPTPTATPTATPSHTPVASPTP